MTATTVPPPKIPIGLNGFGRIGRLVTRRLVTLPSTTLTLEVINNPSTNPEYAAYLFLYDTVHGKFDGVVGYDDSHLYIIPRGYLDLENEGTVDFREVPLESVQGGTAVHKILMTNSRDPTQIPWGKVEYVIDSTGQFTTKEKAMLHTEQSNVKRVLITAPSKDAQMFVFGVNHTEYNPQKHQIISNASCTTNCLAPLVKVLHKEFGIEEALMTTIHSMTASQNLVDNASRKDWRGGRAAGGNIIPSSTGAAKAVTQVLPELQGKITGTSLRVPTLNVSCVDLTFKTTKDTSYAEIMESIKRASQTYMHGVIGLSKDACVSSDFVGAGRSTMVDLNGGIELNKNFFKVIAWYDNEYGYSSRVIDLLAYVAAQDVTN